MAETAFRGFGPKALAFFKALAFHQNREWFGENRDLYDVEVALPMAALITDLSAACAARGLPLKGSPKASIFRINRDIRFAKDKSPYKTHAGAVLTRSGTKNDDGLFYVHIDPEGCFCAAGFYEPEPAKLAALRRAMIDAPAKYMAARDALGARGLAFDPQWSLKRAPREAAGVTDETLLAALKLKSLVVRRAIAAGRIEDTGLVADLADFIADALPLLDWGWSVLATLEPMRR